jgi:16S rRNA (adenine(1408)-N(1))-methyltransferase
VLAAAAAQPDRLVVGVDANAAGMATASRRAAAKPARGGLPNALFVVAAVEQLPGELDGVADLVTVHFPWGSLLRGLLGAEAATMTGLTRVLRSGATLQLLLSSTVRDRGAGVAPIRAATLQALAGSYATWGLAVTQLRPATVADVAAAHSTWGKRLSAGTRRPAWLLRAGFVSPAVGTHQSGAPDDPFRARHPTGHRPASSMSHSPGQVLDNVIRPLWASKMPESGPIRV